MSTFCELNLKHVRFTELPCSLEKYGFLVEQKFARKGPRIGQNLATYHLDFVELFEIRNKMDDFVLVLFQN